MITRCFVTALRLLLALTLLTGAAYPALVTLAASLAFPSEASGSLLRVDGVTVGSSLIGQDFRAAGYFWGRPSAIGTAPYDASNSGASNLGVLSPELRSAIAARAASLRASNPGQTAPIPADLVSASGSGLDPHISPQAAMWQIPRVARERGIAELDLRELVETHTEQPFAGLLGKPRVNVLRLNLALDARR